MSRLIDADELIEWINKQREQVTKKQVAGTDGSIFTRESLVTMQRCISTFENKINNQPTAFDTEKVVEQLMIIHDEGYCPNEDGLECILDKTCSDCYREKIIDIVKKGGVE